MSGFSKYFPITEDEYKKFKKQQHEQILQTQQELQQTPPVVALSSAQNDKTHELFKSSDNLELQEKRFKQLVHMVNELKRQIAEPTLQVKSSTQPQARPTFGRLQAKADWLLNELGSETWNENDELVYEGQVIPQSSKKALTEYAISNWKTKFSKNPPKGSQELQKIISNKEIPATSLGQGFRSSIPRSSIPMRSNQGVVKKKSQVKKISQGIVKKKPQVKKISNDQVEKILADSHMFRRLMKTN